MLDAKIKLMDDYFRTFGIDSAVVGVSGGVDSAVVAHLLARCPSLRKVVGVVAPSYTMGATGQLEAERLGLKVCDFAGIEAWRMDLTHVQREYNKLFQGKVARGGREAWAEGQVLAITRTPLLYGAAAHLQANGYWSLVVGTTNRSEGSYVGHFGKASDGAVDVQVLSDLWKSQVMDLAEQLGVPEDVRTRAPTGDVWDGKTDEETLGCPYAFLEEYLEAKVRGIHHRPHWGDREIKWRRGIEALHATNVHKYIVGSPAIHLAVLDPSVPGGWQRGKNILTWGLR